MNELEHMFINHHLFAKNLHAISNPPPSISFMHVQIVPF
jgi:hypothetical protein